MSPHVQRKARAEELARFLPFLVLSHIYDVLNVFVHGPRAARTFVAQSTGCCIQHLQLVRALIAALALSQHLERLLWRHFGSVSQ